ncbi:La ribonucleoprotein [Asimina triloba]
MQSLRASKSSRKRRRKSGGLQTQSKKKRNNGRLEGDSLLLPQTPGRPITASVTRAENTAADKADAEEDVEEHVNNNSCKVEQLDHHLNENGSASSLQSGQKKRMNDVDANCNEHQRAGCMEDNSGNISILFPDSRPSEEDASTDGHSKVECTQPAQKSRFTGAKKRKSGSVRRFKQDPASCDQDDAQNASARNENRGELLGIEDVESVGDEVGDRNKLDDSRIPPFIIKLIRPIGYSASISNNVQDVSVTFMALRCECKR